MPQINSGVGSGEALTIDPTSFAARATLYDTGGASIIQNNYSLMNTRESGVMMMGQNDKTAVTLRVDDSGGLASAKWVPLIWENWESATLNLQRWDTAATTFVSAVSVSGVNLNSTNLLTSSAVNNVRTTKRVPYSARAPVVMKWRGKFGGQPFCNVSVGLADVISGVANPANAVAMEFTTTNVPILNIYQNSSIVGQVTPTYISGQSYDQTKYYAYTIILENDQISLLIEDTSLGLMIAKAIYNVGTGIQKLHFTTHLQGYARIYNAVSAPSLFGICILGAMTIGILDTDVSRGVETVMAGNHQHSNNSPTASTQNANWTNSTEATSATLSNSAAGYALLGGKFQFASIAGAVTDYALFVFTVPTGFTLIVNAIAIDTWNFGAAGATTPTLMQWSAGANSTALTLATAVASGYRVHHLGSQSLPVGIAIGANVSPIIRVFTTPLITEAGRFFAIILRIPVGTATASQVIAGNVHVDGYLE
jgi:hypothetical protein